MRLSFASAIAIIGGMSSVIAPNTATSTSAVEAAAATALTLSPTSHVQGKAFDRFAIIYLENTDQISAFEDREHCHISNTLQGHLIHIANLAYLRRLGITLVNYDALTHPSQPNCVAASGGDYFGLEYAISLAAITNPWLR